MTWRPALWLVAFAVVVVDQATKQIALETLEPYEVHEVLGEFLSIQLVFNSGAAFSLGDGYTWVMTIIALVVTAGIVYYARRAQSNAAVWIFGIGLGGAIGNLIDRLFRDPSFGQGHVVDMINYNGWFVGNVADIAIVGAAVAVLVLGMMHTPLLAPVGSAGDDGSEPSADAATPSEATGASSAAIDASEPAPSAASPSEPRG
ncbi:signal peptidase II [Demequina activiva]|uniref:Lipoprotein signal peptidase n=1 Tax=Demequina activiva TaxID=1582364 RepID=A0A919Q2A4_9MICO|nr:signal peptidase II [Demequina activiva]GIG54299.1 lipoprotein signal peptidase [Demequina activiva]